MSRCYEVRNKYTIEADATAEAEMRIRLRLGNILDQETMRTFLREALEAHGWQPEGPGEALVRVIEGVRVEVDPATAEVRLVRREHVTAQGTSPTTEREAQQQAEKAAQRRAQEVGAALDREIEGALETVRAALREVVAEVDRRAVLERARQIGKVLDVTEDVDGSTGIRRVVVDLEVP